MWRDGQAGHADQGGNFRALRAGKPTQSSQALASTAGPLTLTSTEGVDGDRTRRIIAFVDYPRPVVESNNADALLDGGIRGMTGSGSWTVERPAPVTLDDHPGREVRFTIGSPPAPEKGTGRARIFLIGERL